MKLTNPLNIFLKQNDPNWFDVIRPTKLPAFPNQFAPNGKVFYGVRQSRLGVKSSTPTKYGELKTANAYHERTSWMVSSLTISASSFHSDTTSQRASHIDL